MEIRELEDIIRGGESTTIQFKERATDAYRIAQEMVAFANSKGGRIIIGVNDKTGGVNGLSFEEIGATNQLMANAADNNVKPAIYIETETVRIREDKVVVVTINEGISKPVMDNKGVVWIKNGADKRRVTSQDELKRLFQSTGTLYADEIPVAGTTMDDIDKRTLNRLIQEKTGVKIEELGLPLAKLLENLNFYKQGVLTNGGLLLAGKDVQRFRPLFSVKCVAFDGNSITVNRYRDRTDALQGNLSELFEQTMYFIRRNLRLIQVSEGFNTRPQLEVPKETIEELVVNALVHRNYFIQADIKIFIFDDRIEIISPGNLPNTLTIDNIKMGISISRNPILYTNAPYLLPFVGVGSGIPRAMKRYPNMELINDTDRELFIARIFRPNAHDESE